MIYFDHNATTPVDERVVESMLPYLTDFFANPSSLYKAGRMVRSAVNTAREQVAALIQVHPDQIIFTSGGTEANNLASHSVKNKASVSAIEHPSLIESVRAKAECKIIPVDAQGLISLDNFAEFLDQSPATDFISIMLANNETGVIQNIQALTRLKPVECLFHTDAVQALAKMDVNFEALGVDMMSISSHKIYGPKGCGALVVSKSSQLDPLIIGGGQEMGLRAGTENVAAIIGFGKAAEIAGTEFSIQDQKVSKLKQKLETALKAIPGIMIFSEHAPRLANTVQFGINQVDGEMLLMFLDQNNIAVSSGSACSAGAGKASDVLTAMQVDNSLAKSAIRISLGQLNSDDQIDTFIHKLNEFLKL